MAVAKAKAKKKKGMSEETKAKIRASRLKQEKLRRAGKVTAKRVSRKAVAVETLSGQVAAINSAAEALRGELSKMMEMLA